MTRVQVLPLLLVLSTPRALLAQDETQAALDELRAKNAALESKVDALASELDMRPLVAHCHLGLGKLHRHSGRRARAREHLALAAAMYREMVMPFWLVFAEAVMSALA